MADERTPLIQVIQIRPARDRYPHHTIRRICTTLLAIVPVVVVAVFLLCLAFPNFLNGGSWQDAAAFVPWSRVHSDISSSWPRSEGIDLSRLLKIVIDTPDAAKAEEWSRYYTAGPHLAGKNLTQAIWTKDLWEELGIPKAEIATYDIYVNYPVEHSLQLLRRQKNKDVWDEEFDASLEEDILTDDPTSGLEDRVPTFHGYSASGNVTAPYVFVNYGTYWDFEDLLKANVTLTGKVALAKYGHVFRGLKVKRAQELGMVGVVMYSDPGDDGPVTEENGVKTYPDGPARNPSSVQRGSVQFLSIAPGDPTTPGYPSLPGAPREDPHHSTPSIPSLPVSYQDALPLLKALNGHGPPASSFNKYWKGGGLGHKGVDYNIGPSPDDLVLSLYNQQNYVTTPMWNVIGVINGSLSDEVVVLGNHRDAWIAGGAGDPNSGSAAMNEVVRSLGIALKAGWKPLRTIVLASWDGEEYGLLGSTEWVEEFLPWLANSAVAYLNVDVGSIGPSFAASAAPLLNKLIVETVNSVPSPNNTKANQTVGDTWDGVIRTMGSGSDFTAFQDFAGIPSVDMGFTSAPGSPVYHYHSNYDSFAWMSRFGDPSFAYHAAIARVWALMAVSIAESPLLPFNATDYAEALQNYLDHVKAKLTSTDPADHNALDISPLAAKKLFRPLDGALAHLRNAATALDARATTLEHELADGKIPWWRWWERVRLYYRVRAVNTKYKFLERKFLYPKGLDGRPWFKHVVFAPGKWTGYSGATFPGLVEAAEAGDKESLERWAGIVKVAVDDAAAWLKE